jgi:hypothetical protein
VTTYNKACGKSVKRFSKDILSFFIFGSTGV